MEAGTKQLPDIRASATVETAALFMLFWDTDRVEVFDDEGRSAGIVTERDLIRSLVRGPPGETRMRELLDWFHDEVTDPARRSATAPLPSHHEPVARDIMSAPPADPIAVGPETPVHEIASLMVREGVDRVRIVDRDRLVGIVTRADILTAVGGREPERVI